MRNLRINNSMVAASVLCVLIGSTAWAQQETPPGDLESLKRMMQEVISKNRELTTRVHELEAEVNKSKVETARDEDAASRINEYVIFGGAIEVQAGVDKGFDNTTRSDIRLETAEFDFEVQVNDWTRGELIVEWDDAEDKLTVDEAYVTLGNTEEYPPFLVVGRIVVPFGISTGDPVADTLTITDPLTIEVFETKENVLLLGMESGGFNAGAYAFNGDTNEAEDKIEQFGATVGYVFENDDLSLEADVDYINSIFDSDGLTEAFPDALKSGKEPGIAAHIKFRSGDYSLVTEYNGALGKFEFTDEDDEPVRLQPTAWQVQAGYEREIWDRDTFFALGYSESDDLKGAFAEKRFLATVGRWLDDGLRLSFEYAHEKDYKTDQGGTGESANAFLSQLTYEW
jgi:hypothetical protein